MAVALQNAKKRGFELEGNSEEGVDRLRTIGGEDDEKRELIEMLLALKSELARTKVSSILTSSSRDLN
jgi:hypothetical protein